MPARPSFAAIPPTGVDADQPLDRSLRRARAIETLSSARTRLDYLSLVLVLACSASLGYVMLQQAADQFLLGLLAVFATGLALNLWFAVRDLRARLDALQELLRDVESEQGGK